MSEFQEKIFRPLFSKICSKFSKTAPTAPTFGGFAPKILPSPNPKILGGAGLLKRGNIGGGNATPLAPLIFAPASSPKIGLKPKVFDRKMSLIQSFKNINIDKSYFS